MSKRSDSIVGGAIVTLGIGMSMIGSLRRPLSSPWIKATFVLLFLISLGRLIYLIVKRAREEG